VLFRSDPLPGTRPPTAARMEKITEIFRQRKITVTSGG
jgi:hypothetical protein